MILVQLLVFFAAASLESTEIDFHHLNSDALSWHLQKVEIMGFIYSTPSGGVVLASDPGLKSCCAGADSQVDKQIYLISDAALDMPVGCAKVQGVFLYDPTWDAEGRLVALYKIVNPHVVPMERSWMTIGIVGGAVALILGIMRITRTKK